MLFKKRLFCVQLLGYSSLFDPLREVAVPKDMVRGERKPSRKEVMESIEADRARVLSVATIRDAIVQRILYRVLLDRAEEIFSTLDNPIPISFAYRPKKSTQAAARAVRQHMKNGYIHVLDVDLRRFFDKIPRKALLDGCQNFVGDNPLTFQLLRRFIYVERVQYSSYHWAHNSDGDKISDRVFLTEKPRYYDGAPQQDRPKRYRWDAGVPQGGVLSGLLANLYLHRFDYWIKNGLDSGRDLRYVRYADDFVILAKSRDDVLAIYEEIRTKLEGPMSEGGFGLEMHSIDPDWPENPDAKTRYVDASKKPIKFVGFAISPQNLSIHPTKVEQFLKKWQLVIESETRLRTQYPDPWRRLEVLIKQKLRFKIIGYRYYERCPNCGVIKEKRRSWIASFAAVSDWQQILAMDEWMRRLIYKHFRAELPQLTRKDLTKMGLPSLLREYKRVRKLWKPCKCRSEQASALADRSAAGPN